MKLFKALRGGIAGALTVNLIHEILKRIDPEAPRLDILGMDALGKTLEKTGLPIPDKAKLFKETMAADIVSNAVYYSLIGSGSKNQVWTRGIILGVLAGLGGVYAPDPLGLKTSPTNRTDKTKVLTIAYYTIGGLVAAAVINSSKKKKLK